MSLRNRTEQGSIILEILVSITLIAVSIAGALPLISSCLRNNQSARTFSGVSGDVQNLLDGYRRMSFDQLLAKIGTPATSITNNQSAQQTVTSSTADATYTVTFTAVKHSTEGAPDAVRVRVAALQERRLRGDASYAFETMIARVH